MCIPLASDLFDPALVLVSGSSCRQVSLLERKGRRHVKPGAQAANVFFSQIAFAVQHIGDDALGYKHVGQMLLAKMMGFHQIANHVDGIGRRSGSFLSSYSSTNSVSTAVSIC